MAECAVCSRARADWDGAVTQKCEHEMCTQCWVQIATDTEKEMRKCPICRTKFGIVAPRACAPIDDGTDDLVEELAAEEMEPSPPPTPRELDLMNRRVPEITPQQIVAFVAVVVFLIAFVLAQ